ncbi:hypothetical protein AC579_10114 [Pseudocercospora musae]|uniref:Domain of unknown function at the cortex 1 domain-containing protein n=1 Tax=Pseudocercospora musae TaxID=113226 RepID=A0A139ISR7_9PEZI|nr:hypothetical protein AC579_10114 [Pseudocercospora musae]
MASSIKSKISQATSSSKATSNEQEKYRLLVTAGPSYNLSTHKTVQVNTEEATYIENEFIRAKIQVRIRGYRGLPSSSPSESSYFNDSIHRNDQYSVGFSFVPKVDMPSKDTVWGNDLDHPIRDRLPPGFNTAFRIVKEFIDPGLACDVYANEPWLYGPSTSCWFALRIGEKIEDHSDFPVPGVLVEGADGSGSQIRSQLGIPSNNEKRRKHFLNEKNREVFIFEKGRLYMADFYNPYLDFANYSLKLPGFSLKVIRYIGDKTHCLRYVFKERDSKDVYLNVNITLLWGSKLSEALRQDEEQRQASGGAGKELVGVVAGTEVIYGEVSRGEEGKQQGRDGAGKTVNGGEDEEVYESAEESAKESAQDGTTSAPSPPEMQLHPGDHAAIAKHTAAQVKGDPIDEIDRLLRETSTKQKRETKTNNVQCWE